MSVVFQDVSYAYGADQPPALSHVSLTIPDGQFLGVIGHTGSGKSTLVQHMNGLLQPTSGRVIVDGLDLADRRSRHEVRRHVGVAFQYPEYQLFAATVREDVAFGPTNLGLGAAEVDGRVRRALERVGLAYDEVAERSPFHLSGGQQRRVALAGILAMEPRTIVLDEPMAGLDPRGCEDILGLVHRLHEDGMTVVMVSHSMEDVAENADEVLVMSGGRVLMKGAPDEVFSRREELYRVGLDVPQATRFQSRLRAAGLRLPQDVHTIEALADAIVASVGTRTKERYQELAARAGGAAGDRAARAGEDAGATKDAGATTQGSDGR